MSNLLRLLKLRALLLAMALCLRAADFPQTELSNGELRLKIYLPDAKTGFYRATRFDWAGMIGSLVYKGHEFYGPWFQRVDPNVRDFTYDGANIVASPCTAAVGPAEEFVTGATQPLGFEDAKPGGTFVKIGVGALKKPDNAAYNRFRLYDIAEAGKWSTHTTADTVEFMQQVSDASSGYGYEYRKTIHLLKGRPVMQIEHRLWNTGAKPIGTNVYDHNFLRVDGEGPAPDYTISTPFQIKSTRPPNPGLAEIRGNQIVYLKPLAGRFAGRRLHAGAEDRNSRRNFRRQNRMARAEYARSSGDNGSSRKNILNFSASLQN